MPANRGMRRGKCQTNRYLYVQKLTGPVTTRYSSHCPFSSLIKKQIYDLQIRKTPLPQSKAPRPTIASNTA